MMTPMIQFAFVEEESPERFLTAYARAGRVGLLGGTPLGHRLVRLGQTPVTLDRRPSLWSHAVIFAEQQGGSGLYESDLELAFPPWRIRNGAQRSPLSKYFDARRWPHLAVLDFQLHPDQVKAVLDACRQMIRERVRYPVGGLLFTGIWYALGLKGARVWGRPPRALFCSAFVQKAFSEVGIRFDALMPIQHLGPEHIWQSRVSHSVYLRKGEWAALSRRGIVPEPAGEHRTGGRPRS